MDSLELDRVTTLFTDRRLSRRQAMLRSGAGLAAAGMVTAGLDRAAAAQDLDPAATPVAPTPPAWEEIDRQRSALAPATTLLAAELVGGVPTTIHGLNADQVFPVGSSFKFYVLGTLAKQIQAGLVSWDQLIAIEQKYKSVPSGDLRFAPSGTEYTVRYVAERMMQKSDNTATDVLIALVGRENVEQMMETMGHHDPGLNIPVLTTREFAFMKLAVPTDRLDAYFAASVPDRRQILANEVDTMPEEILANVDQVKPIEVDRVEWFASRNDLAQAVAWLWAESQKSGMRPIAEVIALETQLAFNGEVWPYVGFKGGSELGVLSATWLLERADRRMFMYSLGFKNPDAGLDLPAIVPVMELGRDRLAATP